MALNGSEFITEDGTRADYLDAHVRELAIASAKGIGEDLPEKYRECYLEGYKEGYIEGFVDVFIDALFPFDKEGVLTAKEDPVRASASEGYGIDKQDPETVPDAEETSTEDGRTDPLYGLTADVPDVSDEEAAEILKEIESMDEEDLEISSMRCFSI